MKLRILPVSQRALRHIILFLAFAFSCGISIDASAMLGPTASYRYATLPPGTYAGNEPGLELVHDYGAFQLWRIDAAHEAELHATGAEFTLHAPTPVRFSAGGFDPGAREILPADFGVPHSDGPALRVVQFIGPVADEWLEALRQTPVRLLQYLPDNAYLLLNEAHLDARLEELVRNSYFLRSFAPLPALYKLDAELAARARAADLGAAEIEITVVLAEHPDSTPSKARIRQLDRDTSARDWNNLEGMQSLTVRVLERDITRIAALGDVIAIERYIEPRRADEVQAQIMAGPLTWDQHGPVAPGYLSWLLNLGFSSNPNHYLQISVVDDGIGNGTTIAGAGDLTLTQNGLGTISRVTVAQNCTSADPPTGLDGHGHINASIAAGYDQRSGFPFRDALGYQRGQGINPFARVANFKVFDASGFNLEHCGKSVTHLIQTEYASGSRISSNSWGASVAGDYNTTARAYDVGTRDALTSGANSVGNQPMIFVFAAGNDGPLEKTLSAPGSAKNVITVGASENHRPEDGNGLWFDGCYTADTGADNAMDVIPFSSRGPAEGGRAKPELVAPGTHVQGTASTAQGYTGGSVCDPFRPGGQTTFAASSGTSHAAPAVAGAVSLVHRYLLKNYSVFSPNAAVVKAYFIAHSRHLSGFGANDTLPSMAQGYGMPDLHAAFDPSLKRIVLNQFPPLTATGNSKTIDALVEDDSKPVRIALAWSDAPGATNTAQPLVNDLDLTVVAGGITYRGNHFFGAYSSSGGSADKVNNYEAVFLPAGTSGPIKITVTASNIAGDGIPNNLDTTDQDYALICANCEQKPGFVVDVTPTTRRLCASDNTEWNINVIGSGDYAGTVSFRASNFPLGSSLQISPLHVTLPANGVSLLKVSTAAAQAGSYVMSVRGKSRTHADTDIITMQLSAAEPVTPTPQLPADGTQGAALRPTLTWYAAPDAEQYLLEVDDDETFDSPLHSALVSTTSYTLESNLSSSTNYYWRVRARNACGDSAPSMGFHFVTNQLTCKTFAASGLPKPIQDAAANKPTLTTSDIVVADLPGHVQEVKVLGLTGSHSRIGDLTGYLLKYREASNAIESLTTLFDPRCGNTKDFNFSSIDEVATGAPQSWACVSPAGGGGDYQPLDSLGFHHGKAGNGTWRLILADANKNTSIGELQSWSIKICTEEPPLQDE